MSTGSLMTATGCFPEATLRRARELFPHTAQGKIYLNHAGTSPLSTRVVEAMSGYLRDRSMGQLDTYQRDLEMVAECRALIQRIIHAESPERIAFQANTSDAINVVAAGMPWKPGDRVLLNTIEFPANVYPFLNLKHRGVAVDFIEAEGGCVTREMVEAHLGPSTRLLALSAVQFLSGHRADLQSIGELCRSRGVVFAVDAIQAVGAVGVDVQRMKIDALSAGAQKWQMSPHGSGFLYVTEELQERLVQATLGWLSVRDPWSFYDYDQPLAASARRYEGGSLIMPSLWGMHAALSTLLEYGMAAIEAHILALTGLLREKLQEIPGVELVTSYGDQERAGIVTIRLPAGTNGKGVFKRILARRATIALREGQLRYSPHFYNTPQEMLDVAELTREALT
ncbi:MAG TPA: aminotransferase class V-fold PLP-dependent enzyme [Bacteroidota bacterium]